MAGRIVLRQVKAGGTDNIRTGSAANFGELRGVPATSARHGVDERASTSGIKVSHIDRSAFHGIEQKIGIAMRGEAGINDDVFVGIANACLTRLDIAENCAQEWHGYRLERIAPSFSRVCRSR